MKGNLIVAMVSIIILSTACSKDKTEIKVVPVTNTWTVGAVTYKMGFSRAGQQMPDEPAYQAAFTDVPPGSSEINGLHVSFKKQPVNGTYELVANSVKEPSDNQCKIDVFNTSAAYLFKYNGSNAKIVQVSLHAGKIRIIIPEIEITSLTNSNNTVKFSASVQEF